MSEYEVFCECPCNCSIIFDLRKAGIEVGFDRVWCRACLADDHRERPFQVEQDA